MMPQTLLSKKKQPQVQLQFNKQAYANKYNQQRIETKLIKDESDKHIMHEINKNAQEALKKSKSSERWRNAVILSQK